MLCALVGIVERVGESELSVLAALGGFGKNREEEPPRELDAVLVVLLLLLPPPPLPLIELRYIVVVFLLCVLAFSINDFGLEGPLLQDSPHLARLAGGSLVVIWTCLPFFSADASSLDSRKRTAACFSFSSSSS